MQPQRITRPDTSGPPPWSPLSISLISLLLPAGAAILTVQNLERLHQLDAGSARRLTLAMYVVCGLGLAALLLSARTSSGQPDRTAVTLLACGVALATYLVQRVHYRAWRGRHQNAATSPWLYAAGRAILYQVIAVLFALPILLVAIIAGAGPSVGHP